MALLIPVERTYSLCSVRSAPSTKRWLPKGEPSTESALCGSKANLRSTGPFRPVGSVYVRRRLSRKPFPGSVRGPRPCESRLLYNATVEDSIALENTTEAGQSSEPTIAQEPAPTIAQEPAPASPPVGKTERFKPRVPGQKVRREDPAVPAEALVEGAVFTGKVTTIQPFGAFVNFGAFTDGLVHISKLSTSYVKTVSDIVTVGQEVKVTILNVEESSGRIALSMIDKESKEAKEAATRAAEAGDRSRLQQGSDGRPINRGRIAGGGRQSKRDEQQKTPTRFSKGQEVEGTVKNKMRSGAFVDLGNNEEGFLRFTEIPGGENMAPDNALQTGEKIKATVLRIERGKVLLTMKPVVDIMSVNRSINTGDDSGAANPFEIAFRAFNLVPKQETSPVSEDVVDDESAVAEADLAAEDPISAAEEKEMISEVAAGSEQAPSVQEDLLPEGDEDAVAQAALATEESAPDVQEEAIPEAFPAPEGSAPAIEREIPEVAVDFPAADVPEASEGSEAPPVANATDEVVSQATSTAVDEEIAAEPTPSEDVVTQSGIAEESPAADKETAQFDVPEVAAASEAAREVEEVIPEAVEAVDDILSAEDSASETEAALEELIVKDEVVVGTAPIVTENSLPDVAVRDIPAEAATEEPIVKDEDVLETAAIVTENPTPDVAVRDIPAEAAMELIVKDEVVVGFAPVVTENAMPDVAVGDIPAEESEAEPPPLIDDASPNVADASTEAVPALEEVIPETTAAVNGSVSNVGDVVAEAAASMVEFPVPEAEDAIEPSAAASEETVPESVFIVKDEVMPDAAVAVEGTASAVEEVNAGAPAAIEDSPVAPTALDEEAPTPAEVIMAAAGIEESPTAVVEEAPTAAEAIMAAAAEATVEEKQEEKMPEPISASEDITASVAAAIIEEKQGEKLREPTPESEVITAAAAAATVEEKQQEKKSAPISAALVKQLRDETGAGMMDCKKALAASGGDIETARETLRKRGLASAEKKASRIASEGLIGSYVHDSRIGVLVEVNCETDFVSRGPAFKSLVEDVGMQVVASQQVQYVSVDDIPAEYVNKEKEVEAQREDLSSKPEAIRGRIVDGRVEKRLYELTLLEQPYIRDDKVLVKDLVKQTVATLGENIKVRRFERYVLGEGLQKKSTDFAAEVAAQTATKAPVEAPKTEETPEPAPDATSTVAVSASLVKELRDQTGAGMMDCKKALKITDNNLEKATEFLRKKGLASADKKSSRLASEGLIGTYIHDGRIGILIEVNCETDFVARGEKFKELVDDLAMQAAAYPQVQVVSVDDIPAEVVAKEKEMEAGKDDLANKPEAIRARIVDGRVAKRLAELSLEEQPYIRNDKKLVKDVVKETVASLGENIQIRRFTRFNLGEGIEKKVIDFAAEVAAQTTGV